MGVRGRFGRKRAESLVHPRFLVLYVVTLTLSSRFRETVYSISHFTQASCERIDPGWRQQADQIETLGYGDGRHYQVFEGGRIRCFLAPLRNRDEVEFATKDKRGKLESFDANEGFRSIGVTVDRPMRRREPASRYAMH